MNMKGKAGFLIACIALMTSCTPADEGNFSDNSSAAEYEFVLPDLVGVDDLSVPSSVTIYRAEKPDIPLDELQNVFSQIDRYSSDPETEIIEDEKECIVRNQTASGESPGMVEQLELEKDSNGILYTLRCLEDDKENYWYWQTMESYYAMERFRNTGSVRSDAEPDEWMERDKEVVADCFRRLGMQNYVYSDGITYKDTHGQKASIQFWTPYIDGIPVSVKRFTEGMQASSRRRFNNDLFDYSNLKQHDEELGCGISVYVTDGRVAVWNQPCHFAVSEKYAEISVVSVQEALKKVDELYSPEETSERKAALVLAELEYKCLEYEGDVYYFPLWTFAVSTHEKSLTPEIDLERDDYTMHGEVWTYYYVNPATGEFFSTWDLGE